MQCPVCAAELGSSDSVCNKCGATKVVQRTPMGVFAGWAGMVLAILWAMLWAALFILPFTTHGLTGFPWVTLVIGTAAAVGLLKYSKSTRHIEWVRRGN